VDYIQFCGDLDCPCDLYEQGFWTHVICLLDCSECLLPFLLVGVFKTPSELATTFLPSIWLARKDWYWVVSASIYRLIWLVFLFCSAPSIILAIFIVDQKLILEILDKYYVVVHQASYNVFPQPLSYCFSPFGTKMNQLRPWNRHYLLRFHLNKIEKR
jgi:hypothetical protein